MFGTIGHVRVKPGHDTQLEVLSDGGEQTIRRKVPGSFPQLLDQPTERPAETVFLALAQAEPTYHRLAAMPEKDSWCHRFLERAEGERTWKDAELAFTLSA